MRSLFNSLTHLHHLFGAGPDGLERPEGVSEGEPRLRLRPALHQLHRAGHQADLAGEVYDPVHLKAGNKFITQKPKVSVFPLEILFPPDPRPFFPFPHP